MKMKKVKNKTWLFFIGLSVLIISLFMISNVLNNKSSHVLSSDEFINNYNNMKENSIIIDVRTKEEYDSGHIKNAINIDFYGPDFEKQISALDKNKNYFIYCRSGHRSHEANKVMKSLGIKNIFELEGGIMSNVNLISK